MKNCIIFKFVAVLLCAASLLGIVGGTAGALVLAEGDLYNKTVDQMLDEKLETDAMVFAEQTALSYASRELGGCPEGMAQYRYGVIPACNYGYSILDAEGNVLASVNPELKDTAEVYTFPATGQYMHLVSTETESELKAKEAQARAELMGRGMADSSGNTIPPEGLAINQVWFTDREGNMLYESYGDRNGFHSTYYYYNDGYDDGVSSSGISSDEPLDHIGFLFNGPDGQLMYTSFLGEPEDRFADVEVYGVMFLSHDGDFYYSLDNPQGLGILTNENGRLRFTGYPVEEAAEETIPETTPETIPETIPETLPEEIAETQAVEETHAEESAEDAGEEHPENTEASQNEEAQAQTEAPVGETLEASSASAVPEEGTEASAETYVEETLPPETQTPETLPPETLLPETVPAETVAEETVPAETEPVLINGKPLEFYQVNRYDFYDSDIGEHTTAKYVYLTLPEMTVEVYLDRTTLRDAQLYDVLRLVRQYRSYLLPAIGISLLVFAITIVYLCTAAGRKPKAEEVRAGGLNRLPLDLYLCIGSAAIAFIILYIAHGVDFLLERDFLTGCSVTLAAAFLCCLLLSGFLFALIAQIKTPGGFWWRNLICIRFVFLCMRLLQWLEGWLRVKFFPWLWQLLKKLWSVTVTCCIWTFHAWEKGGNWLVNALGRFFHSLGRTLNRWFSLMPLTWQWTVLGLTLFCSALIAQTTSNDFLTLVCLVFGIGLPLYGAHCFGTLLESTRKMSHGDLNTKVDDKRMLGCFKDFAGDLNDLADVAMVAAQKQLKSERMKTELITNVSHDIKTPLTSIINYVDLLQKPHTEEEGAQYLEVLDRQSQRLKKLVEDLMDMSKASTGNMMVEITRVDAVESVNQALGEFADKLERARLYPVFRHADDSVPMMADGKLVWRVLSNLLGNAVKYAMPGTRVYLDLTRVDGNVVISLKNISKDELNVDAEELMERFVRGDVSRNTEGSGLGLNIAKSLMELQKGQLQLLVDGDLFKVTLLFPAAE